jgi:hypothetical protein
MRIALSLSHRRGPSEAEGPQQAVIQVKLKNTTWDTNIIQNARKRTKTYMKSNKKKEKPKKEPSIKMGSRHPIPLANVQM